LHLHLLPRAAGVRHPDARRRLHRGDRLHLLHRHGRSLRRALPLATAGARRRPLPRRPPHPRRLQLRPPHRAVGSTARHGARVIAFHDPFARPLHQLGLELVFFGCAALTLRHALRDRRSTFQWLVAFCYGLWMELIALSFLDNYQHAKFTVQLYRDKLPLYVLALYPVFHYTGLKLAERFRAPLAVEALLAGFVPFLMDVAFDLTGVGAGWWRWSTSDPNLATRWLDVPVTSYYWYLLFGPAYALGCR